MESREPSRRRHHRHSPDANDPAITRRVYTRVSPANSLSHRKNRSLSLAFVRFEHRMMIHALPPSQCTRFHFWGRQKIRMETKSRGCRLVRCSHCPLFFSPFTGLLTLVAHSSIPLTTIASPPSGDSHNPQPLDPHMRSYNIPSSMTRF